MEKNITDEQKTILTSLLNKSKELSLMNDINEAIIA